MVIYTVLYEYETNKKRYSHIDEGQNKMITCVMNFCYWYKYLRYLKTLFTKLRYAKFYIPAISLLSSKHCSRFVQKVAKKFISRHSLLDRVQNFFMLNDKKLFDNYGDSLPVT